MQLLFPYLSALSVVLLVVICFLCWKASTFSFATSVWKKSWSTLALAIGAGVAIRVGRSLDVVYLGAIWSLILGISVELSLIAVLLELVRILNIQTPRRPYGR